MYNGKKYQAKHRANLPQQQSRHINKSSPSIARTPACPPIPLIANTSILSTTSKKRNKKKLFTESMGPQEF